MCGRYVLFTDEEEDDIADIVHEIQRNLYEQPGAETGTDGASGDSAKPLRVNGEVFPTQNAPVLTATGSAAMIWGLPGYKGSGVIINARAETVFEKATFRQSMLIRRCVVLSHGFFEWCKRPGSQTKEKLLFNLPGQRGLYMAGLYGLYAGEPRFAVLTTAANDAMRPIHERMPVILLHSEVATYLSDEQTARSLIVRVPPALTFAD